MKRGKKEGGKRSVWGEYRVERFVVREGFERFCRAARGKARKNQFFWLVVLQGDARLQSRDHRYYLQDGSLFGSASIQDSVLVRESRDFRFLLLQFSGAAATRYSEYLVSHYGHYHLEGAQDGLKAWLRQLCEGARDEEDWFEGYEFFCLLHERLNSIAVAPRRILELEEDAEELMVLSRYSLSELAALNGLSSTQLSRKLKTRWGRSPSKVLQRCRVKKGARLLVETTLSVSDISILVGYRSDIAFAHAFKVHYKLTPSAFRERKHEFEDQVEAADRTPSCQNSSDRYRLRFGPFFQLILSLETFEPVKQFDLRFFSNWKSVTINVTLKGESIFEVGNRLIRSRAGTVIVHPRPLKGQYRRVESSGEFHSVSLHTEGELAYDYLRWLVGAHGFVYQVPLECPLLAECGQFVDVVHKERMKMTYTELSYRLAKWLRELQRMAERYPDPQSQGISVFDYEMKDTMEARTFAEYAALHGYSRSHLSRKMSKLSSATPQRVFYQTKYHLAVRLVAETDLLIKDIATEHLKVSPRVFNYIFKRWTEMTPTEFRRLHR